MAQTLVDLLNGPNSVKALETAKVVLNDKMDGFLEQNPLVPYMRMRHVPTPNTDLMRFELEGPDWFLQWLSAEQARVLGASNEVPGIGDS